MELAERMSWSDWRPRPSSIARQYALADALGLSAIHVNRVLRKLREQNLLTLRNGSVKIRDLNGLRELADFRGGYLDARN